MKKIIIIYSLLSFISFVAFSQSWTTATSSVTDNINNVRFASNNVGYAACDNGKILKTTDKGATWATTTSPNTGIGYFTLECISEDIVIVMGGFGRVYKSTDGGTSWIQKNSSSQQINGSVLLSDNTTIFAVGGSTVAYLIKSTDAGESWTALTSPTSEILNGVTFSPSNLQIGWITGEQNAMYLTTNGGANWALQTLPYGSSNFNSQFAITAISDNNVLACGGNQRIMKTTNGGTNWTNINSTSANFYRGCYMYDAQKYYVVGGSGRILYSTNGGSSFSSQASGTSNILRGVTITPCGNSYVVGDGGVIKVRIPTITGGADSYSTPQNETLNVATTSGVLNNDAHQFDGNLTATLIATPTSGDLTLNTDGSFTYVPANGFAGQVTFTYKPTDECSNTSTANITVTINVVEPNVAPISIPENYSVDKNKTKTVATPGVLANDTDANANTTLTATLSVNVLHGALTLNANGSFVYTPASTYTGLDSFAYKAYDGQLYSDSVYVVFSIINSAPVAFSKNYETDKNIELSINAPGVLTNATDFNNDNLTAVLEQTTINGSLTLNSDGSFTYTPSNNYVGLDSFAFKASDGELFSDIKYAVINVLQPNSIKLSSEISNIKIYPTIVSEKIIVQSDRNLNVSIYNNVGVKIMEEKLNIGKNELITNNLPNGFYHVVILADNLLLQSQSIIKE